MSANDIVTSRQVIEEALAHAFSRGHREGWTHHQDGDYGTDYWDDDTPNPYSRPTAETHECNPLCLHSSDCGVHNLPAALDEPDLPVTCTCRPDGIES